jgi:PTH1 family peptidyl-tRNA hydrolase
LKYLIVGLGNIGDNYKNTRHNIGFKVLDAMAQAFNVSFNDKRYGFVATTKYKGRDLTLLKPSTFMNLSGNAVNYWMKKEKIPVENILVIVDDIALPIGSFRLKPKGSAGGHNGLTNISEVLGTNDYARLRFGIGAAFDKGRQINYVLGELTSEEIKIIEEKIPTAIEVIKSFVFIGLELTMTAFNKDGKIKPEKPQENNAPQNQT